MSDEKRTPRNKEEEVTCDKHSLSVLMGRKFNDLEVMTYMTQHLSKFTRNETDEDQRNMTATHLGDGHPRVA